MSITKNIIDPAFMLTPYETAVATSYGSTWTQFGSKKCSIGTTNCRVWRLGIWFIFSIIIERRTNSVNWII